MAAIVLVVLAVVGFSQAQTGMSKLWQLRIKYHSFDKIIFEKIPR